MDYRELTDALGNNIETRHYISPDGDCINVERVLDKKVEFNLVYSESDKITEEWSKTFTNKKVFNLEKEFSKMIPIEDQLALAKSIIGSYGFNVSIKVPICAIAELID